MKEKYTMLNPSIDDLLQKIDNKYILTSLVAKRARQLFEGDESLIDEYFVNYVTTSVHEIEEGKVTYQAKVEEIEAEIAGE